MLARQHPEADSAQLSLLGADGPQESFVVRESQRARRLTARVFPGGRVEIVVPRGTEPGAVQQFVSRHRTWIDLKVREFGHREPAAREALPVEVSFQAVSESWQVIYERAPRAPRVREGDGVVVVRGELERGRLVRHVLQRWLLRRAHARLAPWLLEVATEAALGVNRVQVRRQRTRWGSCSRQATISLNACLMFQPPDVVRYLFAHELAHLVHMNHSRRFWRLVETLEPDWRRLDAGLMSGWRHVPGWALA